MTNYPSACLNPFNQKANGVGQENGDQTVWHAGGDEFLNRDLTFGPKKTVPNRKRTLSQLFENLSEISPSGYSAGLHIRYATPLYYQKTYDPAWQKIYDENAYALRDPTVFWGLGIKGSTRWSAIRLPDPFNILGMARSFGLTYGAVISWGPITSRSIVGIARNDREFYDHEIEATAEIVRQLHDAAEPPTELTDAQIEALRYLSDGYRHAAAAAEIGISESALKARLKSARVRLSARTTAQAIRKAREYQFLK